jgi:aspartyl-tRNA(Asn)/glutamyl-tRNA(Gln) amidotransferase subunit B
MGSYIPTIGLEVHAELKTKTKMFCNCANNPDEERPNVNVCPVCLAHPGTLPVINKEAVRHILRMGVALGGELADKTEFDRKSYFYPDIPKGYQISQYEKPFVKGGMLAGVAITRVHLEEDTARSSHLPTQAGEGGKSLVDFNRAGIPLMELVTEPVIHDAETAGRFARELQLLLRALGAGEANLEKGEMRIEANISVSKEAGEFGTKVEVKNINSFRAVERAIAYEIQRQTELLERGEQVVQATRGWDEGKQETFHQRFKEGSADYRYFPEPDLPKLSVSLIPEFSYEEFKATLPELPWERRARYEAYGIKPVDAATIANNISGAAFFDAVCAEIQEPAGIVLAGNFFISDIAGEPGQMSAAAFVKLLTMFSAKELSSRGAKDILALLVESGGDPEVIAKEQGLIQVHDIVALGAVVDVVLKAEEKAVAEYRLGKQAALQYLLGKAMKESRGAGNPEELKKILVERLG